MERNLPENRVHGRNRKGTILVKRDGSVGTGSYTMDYRKKLLERVRELEARIEQEIISDEEEMAIKRIWAEETADLTSLIERKLGAN